jgi:hypothetical protein
MNRSESAGKSARPRPRAPQANEQGETERFSFVTGEVTGGYGQIADAVVHLQTRMVTGPPFLGLLAQAQLTRKRAAHSWQSSAQRGRDVPRDVLQRAIQRLELRRHTDIDSFIDGLGGAVTFRLLQGDALVTIRFTTPLFLLLPGESRTKEPR